MAYETTTAGARKLAQDEAKKREELYSGVSAGMVAPTAALKNIYGGGGTSNAERSLVRTRRAGTVKAFGDERAAAALRARRAGFGYAQPLAMGDQANLDRMEATQLSNIPGNVQAEMLPLKMQAAGMQAPFLNTQAGMGASYNPYNYYNLAMNQNENDKNRKSSFWGNIMDIGKTAALAFL
jgi:hypothetical protein